MKKINNIFEEIWSNIKKKEIKGVHLLKNFYFINIRLFLNIFFDINLLEFNFLTASSYLIQRPFSRVN